MKSNLGIEIWFFLSNLSTYTDFYLFGYNVANN